VCATIRSITPWFKIEEAEQDYSITPIKRPMEGAYDAIILAVAHHEFKTTGGKTIREFGKDFSVIYGIKYVFSPNETDLRL
jgi:UDP-N-acetyl-D-galactosamine dehydrogenase